MTSNTGGGRSGKDANSVIASIHTFDAAAGCDATTFQPCSDKALASHKAYVDSFRSIYTINNGLASNAAVATGRYAEDVYYNGNVSLFPISFLSNLGRTADNNVLFQPWYLTTFAAAEQLYDALTVWDRLGALNITSVSLPFFQQFAPSVKTGTYASTSTTYTTLTKAIRDYADGFIAVAAKYTPENGALAEQYDRNTGAPLSARDLTWSYAALLTANAARNGFVQNSWDANGLVLPEKCSGNPGKVVAVTFNVDATTVFGGTSFFGGAGTRREN